MSENIKFQKTVYDGTSYSKVVDTQFSQLKKPPLPQEVTNLSEDNPSFKLSTLNVEVLVAKIL